MDSRRAIASRYQAMGWTVLLSLSSSDSLAAMIRRWSCAGVEGFQSSAVDDRQLPALGQVEGRGFRPDETAGHRAEQQPPQRTPGWPRGVPVQTSSHRPVPRLPAFCCLRSTGSSLEDASAPRILEPNPKKEADPNGKRPLDHCRGFFGRVIPKWISIPRPDDQHEMYGSLCRRKAAAVIEGAFAVRIQLLLRVGFEDAGCRSVFE